MRLVIEAIWRRKNVQLSSNERSECLIKIHFKIISMGTDQGQTISEWIVLEYKEFCLIQRSCFIPCPWDSHIREMEPENNTTPPAQQKHQYRVQRQRQRQSTEYRVPVSTSRNKVMKRKKRKNSGLFKEIILDISCDFF